MNDPWESIVDAPVDRFQVWNRFNKIVSISSARFRHNKHLWQLWCHYTGDETEDVHPAESKGTTKRYDVEASPAKV